MSRDSIRKAAIRARYEENQNWDESDIDIIPVTVELPRFDSNTHKRVCAYARVSTDDENQTTSLVLQQITYKKMIEEHENWEFVKLYYDEGITGTSISKRDGFRKMIADCRSGKIDMIITKSVSRFARNLVDSMAIQQELARLNPPVGVFFETEHVYSLDTKSKMILANLAMFAEWESQNKSEIMNWSIDKRYELGQYLTPSIFGYDKDEQGRLVINEKEAPLIRLLYYLFLEGFSVDTLADIAMESGYKKRDGGNEWSGKTILGMLQNEKYCGELRARKTYTPDYLTHLSKKNRGNKKQYYIRNHHAPIISPEIYRATLKLIELHKYVSSGYTLPRLMVVKEGALKGYIPIDRNWDGFRIDDYVNASLSIGYKSCQSRITKEISSELLDGIPGVVIVGNQLFSSKEDYYMTISNSLIAFNLPCVEKMNTENVALYFNPIDMRIAVLTSHEDGRNYQWATYEGKWKIRPKSIVGFNKILLPALGWLENYRYRIKGKAIYRLNETAIIFDLRGAEVCVNDQTFYPNQWKSDFGSNIGKIEDEDFANEKLIVSYQNCDDVACALSEAELEKLADRVKGMING